MTEMEQWVDIKGYEGCYQISNLGNVRSLDRGSLVAQERYTKSRWTIRRGKVLARHTGSDGYYIAVLCKDGRPCTQRIHRLVALHFIPNPEGKPAINHMDANPLNNRVSNLEWCTIRENNKHTRDMGRWVAAGTYKMP